VGKAEAMSLRGNLVALSAAAALASIAVLGAGVAGGSVHHCKQLSGKMSEVPGSGSAGHVVYRLKITDSGAIPCTVGNHPKLTLLDAHGLALPTRVIKEGPTGMKTIRPGHSVSARLRFSPDVPSVGEPVHARCEPIAHKVKVVLAPRLSLIAPIVPPTSVCGHGAIEERPLR
jgi:hypothetical protein